jgi:predicted nucleotidyltransferase
MKALLNGEGLSVDSDLKQRVAKEAATLLYFGAEKEYKQAKLHAAETLGTHFLPSNLEVALELDRLADEQEGATRKDRLVEMRKEALTIMRLLSEFSPVLIGSVWRGTIKVGSDIDIAVYTDDPEHVPQQLKNGGIKVTKTAWTTVNKQGVTLSSFHVYAQTTLGYGLEVVARSCEEAGRKRRCETFGDLLRGLTIRELQKVLTSNPTQKFLPN